MLLLLLLLLLKFELHLMLVDSQYFGSSEWPPPLFGKHLSNSNHMLLMFAANKRPIFLAPRIGNNPIFVEHNIFLLTIYGPGLACDQGPAHQNIFWGFIYLFG